MAESIAESFITKLASVAVQEASLALGVYDDLQDIKHTVSFIKSVLLDAELKQHRNNELSEWLRQVKQVFYDAENIVDDFECEALRKHVVNASRSTKRKVRRFFSNSSNPILYRLRMAHQLKDIKQKLEKVASNRHKFGLQTVESNNLIVQRPETHSFVKESDVIGREQEEQKIIELLGKNIQGPLSVITIVGIGGLGKTTLAKSVFNEKSTLESFSLRMWVSVSINFELKNVLDKILKAANDSAPNPIQEENLKNFNMDQVQNHLRNMLAGQKFLLVLDDIWNVDRVKWQELKDIIQVGAKGSKVLVTTQSHTVANLMATMTPQFLQGLSRKHSMSVFLKWAFREGEEKNHPRLMKIGKRIVDKCGGLPLALRTLGSSLFGDLDKRKWKFVRDSHIWSLQQNEDDILPALKLSYDRLPFYLKRCFACFSFFKKGYLLFSYDVISLWQGLGFLPSANQGSDNLEDVGRHILNELWSRSFLQDFSDFADGYCFRVHDLMYDLAIYVARDEIQQVKSKNESISDSVLHLSFIKNDLLGEAQIPTSLRTIMFPVEANNEDFIKDLVSRCKYLRVFHLLSSSYESLPRCIGKLKHLRCLILLYNRKLKRLPKSICKLQSLQTLNLLGCEELEILPGGIGKLTSLRYLVITTKQSESPNEIAKLKSLKILSIQKCPNFESLFDGIEFPSVKTLMIGCCQNLKYLSLGAFPNLEDLVIENCHQLALSMGYGNNQTTKSKLKTLNLKDLPQLVAFPQWMRGWVNSLQVLTIYNCAVERIDGLSFLICLKQLNIARCPRLFLLPNDLNCLPNLKKLEFLDCPELCRRYQSRGGQDWPKISRIIHVTLHCVFCMKILSAAAAAADPSTSSTDRVAKVDREKYKQE